MPSHPPETEFYEDEANHTLWRDFSRLYEDFCGPAESDWPERKERFLVVLSDIENRLGE